jgi:hypothetical protein
MEKQETAHHIIYDGKESLVPFDPEWRGLDGAHDRKGHKGKESFGCLVHMEKQETAHHITSDELEWFHRGLDGAHDRKGHSDRKGNWADGYWVREERAGKSFS